MISNEIPDQEMERKLKVYFEAESARLRAPAGLWERIESILEEASRPRMEHAGLAEDLLAEAMGVGSCLRDHDSAAPRRIWGVAFHCCALAGRWWCCDTIDD